MRPTPEESYKLKDYCDYLIEKYIEINPHYDDSRIYYMLKEYSNTGLMKDMINNQTDFDTISDILGNIAKKINVFFNEREYYMRKNKIENIKHNIGNENQKWVCK